MTAPGAGTPAATTPGRAAPVTLGQLVYDTGHRGYATDEDWSPLTWEQLTDAERADWEAAAQAAIDAVSADVVAAIKAEADAVHALEAERDSLTGRVAELRQLVGEILAVFGPSGSGHTARVGQVQIAKWRQRAGIEVVRELTTGSTAHEVSASPDGDGGRDAT